jgi:hypothetical protein
MAPTTLAPPYKESGAREGSRRVAVLISLLQQ